MEEYDNQFKITYQRCNGFKTCSDRGEEILCIIFIFAGMSTLGLYPEDIVPEKFYFQWPVRTKM